VTADKQYYRRAIEAGQVTVLDDYSRFRVLDSRQTIAARARRSAPDLGADVRVHGDDQYRCHPLIP
jgi:hypothetical protein